MAEYNGEIMNLILLFEDDFIRGRDRVRLAGRRLKHALDVHRVEKGDVLRVGLEGGLLGTGKVTRIEETLEMDVELFREPPEPLPLTLVMALPRPKVLRRVLFSVSAMGVKRIFLLNSYRVEKSFWQSPTLREEHITRQLILGLEQAQDTILPKVFLRDRFKPFVEDELPALAAGTLRLVGHPSSSEPCPRCVEGPVTLAMGPEGGFIPYEIEKFIFAGFSAVNLGERILPVETAVPLFVSRLF